MLQKMNKKDIKELTREQLVEWLESCGIEPYRAIQIFKWVYVRQVDTFSVMTDISQNVRKILSAVFSIDRLEKVREELSKDGSKKYLFGLKDGKFVESVLIPEKNHYTLCISSQVGCAQGCIFCLTGKNGFVRNLTSGEIIGQVRDIANTMDDSKRLTNIVFMGMGEPLANYKNVVNAIYTITDSDAGLGFSNRRITVSTAGIVAKLADLGRDTKVNLAVSLNATDDRTRDMLMPINRKHPLETLIDACVRYPLKQRRKITIEYILIKGVNDSKEDAWRLVKLLGTVRSKINLIPFNPYQGSKFQRPDENVINQFQEILKKNNYTAVVRYSKGLDISAACGQLEAKEAPFI